jgi:hypothetical protein
MAFSKGEGLFSFPTRRSKKAQQQRSKAMKNGNRTSAGKFLIGGIVAALALACTADAVQTTTTPNASFITYSLAAGTNSRDYLAQPNISTLIMANCTTTGFRGVGQVTLLRIPSSFVEWAGFNSTANATDTTRGFSGTEGTHIMNIDFSSQVWLEVGASGGTGPGTRDSVRISNESNGVRSGNMTWIW